MIKVKLKASTDKTNNVSTWLETYIMYPQQIFMIQEQKNFNPKSGVFANIIFSTGGQVVANFKDQKEYDAFVKEVFGVVEDAVKKVAA